MANLGKVINAAKKTVKRANDKTDTNKAAAKGSAKARTAKAFAAMADEKDYRKFSESAPKGKGGKGSVVDKEMNALLKKNPKPNNKKPLKKGSY